MDFSKVLVRSSALHVLFTEPQSKSEKDAGELSKTAKTYLNDMYIEQIWGLERDITTKEMEKGTECEDEAIAMISFLDDKSYAKNTERRENLWITGHADVVEEAVHDVKCSWSPWTFIPKLTDSIDKIYFYQLQGYMWLWGKKTGYLRYCLVNTPDMILQNELRKLLFSMNVATDLNPEYMEAAANLKKEHIFNHIPISERVITLKVERDQSILEHIPGKVNKAREYLAYLHSIHMGKNKPLSFETK